MADDRPDVDIDWDRAHDTYIELLNQGRRTKAMVRNIETLKILDAKMATKHALLQVLSTKVWLDANDITGLFSKLGYSRRKSSIRGGLRRLITFGFAVVRIKEPPNPHHSKEWQMTQRGEAYLANPPPPKQGKTRAAKGQNGTQTGLKRGTAGGTTMCIPAGKPTFVAAVKDAAQRLIASGTQFSAFSVTKTIRDELIAGTLPVTIDDKETGIVHVTDGHGGHKPVPNIVHQEVKDIVHDMFHSGEMVGYDRVHIVDHWEYAPAGTIGAVPNAPASDPAATTAPINTAPPPVLPSDPLSDPAADPAAPAAPAAASVPYDGTPTL